MVGRPRVFVQANPVVSPRRVRVEGRLVSARLGDIDLTRTQEMQMPGLPAVQETAPAFVLFDGYRHMPITEAMVTIGRSLDNDVILDDRRVSRQHAQLRRRYGQYVLYDLDSTGGVTVNGRPVRECILQAGDVIALAGAQVRFERADVVDDALSSSNVTRVLPPSSRLRRQGQGTGE